MPTADDWCWHLHIVPARAPDLSGDLRVLEMAYRGEAGRLRPVRVLTRVSPLGRGAQSKALLKALGDLVDPGGVDNLREAAGFSSAQRVSRDRRSARVCGAAYSQ